MIEALRARGLWPERERRELTQDEKRAWAQAKAARERELDDLIQLRAQWVSLLHQGRDVVRRRGLAHKMGDWIADCLDSIEARIAELDSRIDRLKGRAA